MSTGIITDPMSFEETLQPGSAIDLSLGNPQTVYLRGGTYSGQIVNELIRTAGTRVTFEAYRGERAIIDGRWDDLGAHCTFKDIEFTHSSWTTRVSEETGSNPTDMPDGRLFVRSPGAVYINCIFHNTYGAYFGAESVGAVYYGCLSYHNGWNAPDRPHGHGYYCQNDDPVI